VLLLGITLTGSIAHQEAPSQVAFEAIAAAHFSALYVKRDTLSQASAEPLVLRVTPLGNGSIDDLRPAAAWMREHWNVRLVVSPNGVPLYFTDKDITSRGDPSAIGSSLSTGVALERVPPRVMGCVVAHELGHVLGLGHAPSDDQLMWTHCTGKRLDTLETSKAERNAIGRLHQITAYTLSGPVLWAYREA